MNPTFGRSLGVERLSVVSLRIVSAKEGRSASAVTASLKNEVSNPRTERPPAS